MSNNLAKARTRSRKPKFNIPRDDIGGCRLEGLPSPIVVLVLGHMSYPIRLPAASKIYCKYSLMSTMSRQAEEALQRATSIVNLDLQRSSFLP